MKNKIDILLLIDGTLEDIKQCISSIQAHTDLSNNRLVIISNQNIDENIKKFLDSLVQDGIYKFEEEKAFDIISIFSRQRSITEKNDVILLDSNTIVTSNWIEKLRTCAYNAEEIGIVSPLTNLLLGFGNDDHYSFLENFNIDEYNTWLENISLCQYPVVPTANFGCTFIKKELLDDVITEKLIRAKERLENIEEFCKIVVQLGYTHVLCDNCFIYCNKTSRFPMIDSNAIEKWNNTLSKKNIELYKQLNYWNGKKNIFYLVQADFREGCSNNIGGTQLHVKDLVVELKKEFNVFVAARDGEFLRVTAYIEEKNITFSFHIGAIPEYFVYRSKKLNELFNNLLIAFRINLVHVHHTMGLTLELYYSAKKMNIPVYTTLHDYYFICPTLRLLDENNKSCIGINDTERCSKCLKKYLNIDVRLNFVEKWRAEYKKVLEISEKIFIPSKSATKIVLQYYPEVKDKIQIISHGINPHLFYKNSCKEPYNHKQLHIAFVGGISEVKGSALIYKIITQNKNLFEWFIFGGIGSVELYQLKQENLTKTGWYKKEELKALLQQYEIDIVCLLSIVEETYCYTLSEVVACGVPVIATDIGALGERVKEMGCGWLVSPEITANDFSVLLKYIQNNSLVYEEKWKTVRKLKIRTNAQMAEEYRHIYENISVNSRSQLPFDAMSVLKGYLSINSTEHNDVKELMDRNCYLEQELSIIKNSNIFRYMQRIAKYADRIKGIFHISR